ncbi:hypothetical protein KUTeg_017136 [Tegillarca granosa]|uniref:Uncharacterized protein n=1 Tax=Tegillarca granosa TaxID=220873 RepID=A0ABQ9EMW8_TEGGR|nr:hypothetical protein KUTeg_017136 [Tegillarca granosa]
MLKWKLHNALQKRNATGATTEFHWRWFTLIGPDRDGAKPFENIREISQSDAEEFLVVKAVIDEKDEEVIISLSHRGKFYKTSKDPECENSVFQIRDLLVGNPSTPVYIRHVVGEIPMLTSGIQ